MDAWADGLNYYLATHPEGEAAGADPVRAVDGASPSPKEASAATSSGSTWARSPNSTAQRPAVARSRWEPEEPKGSNGIAIAPQNTANGRALLLINPHTSFYFRSELQMSSDAGLNAYGASTWGQFFIYQGFNANAGWMHTSSGVDNVDEFAGGYHRLRPGDLLSPRQRQGAAGAAADHAALTRARTGCSSSAPSPPSPASTGRSSRAKGAKWLAFSMMWKPVPALEQSWLRTRTTRSAPSYLKVADRQANSSNDTLFADRKGEIAYLHPQFVPVRDARFDYPAPVDGSDPAADWQGLHAVASLPNAIDPATGWAMNTNNWPWSAAGAASPKAADYPALHGPGRRECARRTCDAAAQGPQGLDRRAADGGGVRPVSDRVRATDPATGRRLRRAARGQPVPQAARRRRSICCAAGTFAGRRHRRRPASRCSGAMRCGRTRSISRAASGSTCPTISRPSSMPGGGSARWQRRATG